MQDVTPDELTGLRQNFERCDHDADGWITTAEFSTLLQSLDGDLSADECLLAFEMTDGDGDGLISFEEFVNWWTD